MRLVKPLLVLLLIGSAAAAETARLADVPEWKAVFARVETRDRVPARSRLGGVVERIAVSEGDQVRESQVIGYVYDEKLQLQMAAIEATALSLQSQLQNAETELARGETLLARGSTTAQRVDALRTEVEVLRGRINTVAAERKLLEQRMLEGEVLAPVDGRVLQVPITKGSVVLAGEPVALIGGGGFFLRLAIPERHAASLVQGAEIYIGGAGFDQKGTLAKIYPLIENGRVIVDVEVDDLATGFVDARVLVRLPVGSRQAIVVPAGAIHARMGLDFVRIRDSAGTIVERSVVPGESHEVDGSMVVEILSGLQAGQTLVTGNE